MTNESIYNQNILSYLANDMKNRFALESEFNGITTFEILSTLNADAITAFLDQFVLLNGSLSQLKQHWFGPLLAGQRLEREFTIVPNALDQEALGKLCGSLVGTVVEDESDAAKKTYSSRVNKMKAKFIKIFGEAGVATVSRFRDVSALEVETDVNVSSLRFEVKASKAYLKIPFIVHDAADYYFADNQKHIDEYAEHFIDVKSVTEWICAIRFGPRGRQDSYLHIQAPSGFGKSSVFMQAWKELGYGHETTLQNITTCVKGQTGTESPIDFVRAAVIFLDEANTFAKELKNITTTIPVTEKFKPRVDVPIYAKIMVSKEDPTFLSGEVGDSQVINRFATISYIENGLPYKQFLADKGYVGINHTRALRWLIVETMNKWVAKYRADRLACEDEAAQFLNVFNAQFGAHNTLRSSEDNPEIIGEQFLEFIEQSFDSPRHGVARVKKALLGTFKGHYYCSGTDYNLLWEEFGRAQGRDTSWIVSNTAKLTKKYSLLADPYKKEGKQGKTIVSKIDTKQARWCIFEKLGDELKIVGGTDVDSFSDEEPTDAKLSVWDENLKLIS